MIIALLILIATGVLLASEKGQELLIWIMAVLITLTVLVIIVGILIFMAILIFGR